jgi:hypothetical protein
MGGDMQRRLGHTKPQGMRLGIGTACLTTCLLLSADAWALPQEALGATRMAPRLRLGGSVGVAIGSFERVASGRAGIQFTPLFATSIQVTRASTSDFMFHTEEDKWTSYALLFELMPKGGMIAIGGGASFASGVYKKSCFSVLALCDPPPSYDNYTGAGFDARFSATFGATRPTFRGGLSMELALHKSPHSTMISASLGLDMF